MVSLHIEIGCPLGGIRPQTYLNNLITSLQSSENNNIVEWATQIYKKSTRLFNKIWRYVLFFEIESSIKDEVQTFFQTKLTELYHSGSIRY